MFNGSALVDPSTEDPFFQFDYFFFTDLNSFTRDFCYVKRKRKFASEWNPEYQNLNQVEVLKLNLSRMSLLKVPVDRLNERQNQINLLSRTTSRNKTILHQIRTHDISVAPHIKASDFRFFELRVEFDNPGKRLEAISNLKNGSKYRLESQRSKKRLISVQLERIVIPNISNESPNRFWMYQHCYEAKSELVFENETHCIMELAGPGYIVLDKTLRKAVYFFTQYDWMSSNELFFAFMDGEPAESQLGSLIEEKGSTSKDMAGQTFTLRKVNGINLVFANRAFFEFMGSLTFSQASRFENVLDVPLYMSCTEYSYKNSNLLYFRDEDNIVWCSHLGGFLKVSGLSVDIGNLPLALEEAPIIAKNLILNTHLRSFTQKINTITKMNSQNYVEIQLNKKVLQNERFLELFHPKDKTKKAIVKYIQQTTGIKLGADYTIKVLNEEELI